MGDKGEKGEKGEKTSKAKPSKGGDQARTDGERQAALEKDFQKSLDEFDRKLQREQKILAEKRTGQSASGGAGGRGGTGGGLGGGSGPGESGDAGESSGARDGGSSASVSGDSPDAALGEQGGGAQSGDEKKATSDEEELESRIPDDIPDGRGDDIIARQLREAAMKEDDPELREKLWQEYRDYKSGKSRSRDERSSEKASDREGGSDASDESR